MSDLTSPRIVLSWSKTKVGEVVTCEEYSKTPDVPPVPPVAPPAPGPPLPPIPPPPPAPFIKRIFSSDPTASYGRLISAISFALMLIFHVLIMVLPKSIFVNLEYQSQVLSYLFYLTLAGYGITSLKSMSLPAPIKNILGLNNAPTAVRPPVNSNATTQGHSNESYY
jgi:hypothetical protein